MEKFEITLELMKSTDSELNDFVKSVIDNLDTAYRSGEPIIEDSEFDKIVEYYGYKPKFYVNQLSRKVELPVKFGSMEKVKNFDELVGWMKSTNVKPTDIFVITPKYDGISIISDNNENAWSSGKEGFGMNVSEHFKLFRHEFGNKENLFYKGELIMNLGEFDFKYSKTVNINGYENARNLVSGKISEINPSEILKDTKYLIYTVVDKNGKETDDKSKQLEFANTTNPFTIPYIKMTAETLSSLRDNDFIRFYQNFATDGFEIDGLIIEYDNLGKREQLGFETNSYNPKFARAFKHERFADQAETEIVDIRKQISKLGTLEPVVVINPVRLNGATITNVYADNERFLREAGIGIGSKVTIRRAGSVIPRIVKVEGIDIPDRNIINKERNKIIGGWNTLNRVSKSGERYDLNDFDKLCDTVRERITKIENSKYQPFDKEKYGWDKNGVNIVLKDKNSDETVAKQKLVSFFEILGATGISDGIIEQLWRAGYQDLKTILDLKVSELEVLEGWGSKKASMVVNAMVFAVTNVTLEKVMHASGFFSGLGSKKLVFLTHFKTKPTIEQVKSVDGFSDITAEIFVENWDKFWSWLAELPIVLSGEKEINMKSEIFNGKSFVFTGFRSVELENKIKENGGEIKSSISSKVTHLVMKTLGSGSSKEKKAKDLGLQILDEKTLKELLESVDKNETQLF